MDSSPNPASHHENHIMRLIPAFAFAGLLTGCATHTVAPIAAPQASASPAAQANARLIENFYRAFQRRDGEAMAAAYAADARFSDPVFTHLTGSEPGDMWRMLTGKAQDFSLAFDGIRADEHTGEVHWIATYTFSQTGRTVVNDIHSRFEFRDGKIAVQQDRFDLWKWSRQALGVPGYALGWSPLVQGKIRKLAAKGLADFRKENGR
jgi:ketosteroid isomerase-like protein